MTIFNIPRNLRDVERKRLNELCVTSVPDLDDVGPSDVEAAYHECISSLANGPLNILSEDTFDAIYTVVRSVELLDAGDAARFTTIMSQNLSVLVTSGLEELRADSPDKGDRIVTCHRSAIHAYAFFLSVTHASLHARALDTQKAEASAKGSAPKKRGKAKVTDAADLGDGLTTVWPGVVERVVKALSRTLKANLDDVLYRSSADKCRLVEVCVLTVARCMEDGAIAKLKNTLTACLEVAALSSTWHANANSCLELTAEALFRVVMEHDHGPDLAIQAAVVAAGQYGSIALGKALVMKFSEFEPETYDDIATRDTKPVKRAAEMLSGMAAGLPAVLHASISQLIPYFGCKTAVTIRSNLVICMGHLMEWYMARGMDEKGSRLLQMNRQNAVQTLVARVNDVAALVRKTALNVIEHLAERKCWPIEYIVVAAQAAVARLEDGALPAGAALSLLCSFVHITAMEKLTDTFLVSSLNRFEEHLKGMQPDVMEEGEDRQDEGPQWEKGALGGDNGSQQPQPGRSQDPSSSSQQGIIMPTQLDSSDGALLPGDAQDNNGGAGLGGMTYTQMRFLVASVKALLELSRTLAAALPEVEALLISDSADVTEKAIQLLTICSQKQLQGVADSWRRVWHMVFSTFEKVRETVMDAFYNFLLPGKNNAGTPHRFMVNRLVQMVSDLALCDEEALEELMRLAVTGTTPGATPMFESEFVRMVLGDLNATVLRATLLEREGGDALMEARDARILAGRLSLLCSMIARHAPQLVLHDVERIIAHLKRSHTVLKDVLLVRNLSLILGDTASALHAAPKGRAGGSYQPASHVPNALAELLSVLVSSHLPQAGGSWPPAAQAALAAIYRLHPEPHKLLWPLMNHLAKELVCGRAPATQIARTIFLVGCIATQQLATIDKLAKRVRQERAAEEKAAAEKPSPDDMNAQLGTGQAREHQLDALQEDLEARFMGDGLITVWGKLVSELCHTPDLLKLHPDLASAAMATLAKFMAMDPMYCEDNCPIFFTRLTGGSIKLAPRVRCGMLVALGDLGRRHPNVMEPWTERMFVCLNDENEEVATTCLRILAHLILSDMTKPKGHMAHVARCLVSPSAAVRDLAIRLFNSLSKKQAKGGANKVYQYLPEIISTITRGDPLPEQDFKAMMHRLLGYVKADKLADKLKERLCERFQNVVCEFATSIKTSTARQDAEGDFPAPAALPSPGPTASRSYEEVVREWRSLADCIALIPYSEKGLRACMESMRYYKHALGDEHIYQVFKGIAEHGRRGNRSADLKQEVAEYEARLLEAHTSLREEQMQQAATAAARAPSAVALVAETKVLGQVAEIYEGPEECPVSGAEQQQQSGMETPYGSTSDASDNTTNDLVGSDMAQNLANGARGHRTTEAVSPEVDDDEEMVSVGDIDPEDFGEGDAEIEKEHRNGKSGEGEAPERKALIDEENDEKREMPDEEAKPGATEVEEGADEGAFADAETEWNDGSAEDTPATPLHNRVVRYNRERVVASSATYTPMAITPALSERNRAERGTPEDSMAWSPAPSCLTSTAPGAMPPAAPPLQENTVSGFPGFHIKPDPDGHPRQLQSMAWLSRTLHNGGVAGVYIKPDPDGPCQ